MNTQQIYSVLCWDKNTNTSFKGVYPADLLPNDFSMLASFVVNTDESSKPGVHWVAFYFDKHGRAEYFDSYGMPPLENYLQDFFSQHGNNHKFNAIKLQGDASKSCGYYCILYLTQRAKAVSMEKFLDKFSDNKVYDGAVESYIKSVYSKVPLRELTYNQSCCSKK